MKTQAIIPARLASTRLPKKPLCLLGGKPLVMHVYEAVAPYVDGCVVATDAEEVYQLVRNAGGEAIMTSPKHKSGTDRCLEAYKLMGQKADVILNIQGDEPFVKPEHLEALIKPFEKEDVEIVTLCNQLGYSKALDPNVVKVVKSYEDYALYFSRAPIPYYRDQELGDEEGGGYLKHLGFYAYTPEVLEQLAALPVSTYEAAERLEQLRWLENGYRLKCITVSAAGFGIDTPEDLMAAEKMIKAEE